MSQQVKPLDLARMIKDDLATLVCGDYLGGGLSRQVYEFALHPKWVIKFEVGDQFQNIMEWQVWQDVAGTRWNKWFAPCVTISPCGTILVMGRTTPVKKLQARMPSFFEDIKLINFGTIDDQLVCHDYGYNKLLKGGFKHATMAKWK